MNQNICCSNVYYKIVSLKVIYKSNDYKYSGNCVKDKHYILKLYKLQIFNYVMLKNLDYCFNCNKYDKILRNNLVY